MKLRTSAPLCALFLLLGATMAFAMPAEPTTVSPDNFSAVTLPAQPATHELAAAGDCEEKGSPFASTVFASGNGNSSLAESCGSCSENICVNQSVGHICGPGMNGVFPRCVNWSGRYCAADGNARCRCTSDPIP